MAINFPVSLDELINPQASDSVQSPSHSEQHADANDAIVALQEKVGVDNSTDADSLDYKIRQIDPDNFDPAGSAATAQSNAEDYADGLAVNYDPAGSAASAETAANEYTDEAVASLGNTLPDTYVPLTDVGQIDGVASLDSNGKVPLSELDIDPTILSVASAMITGGTHTNLSVTYDAINEVLNFTAQGGGGGANVSISANAPTSPSSGDLWLDSDTATLYAYDGAFWVEISGAGGGGGGGSGNFILSETAPTSPTEGDTWFDTANAKLYVYYDSFWIEAIATGATGPQGPAFLDYTGNWNSGVSYLENDGVTYQGSLWRLNEVNSPAGTAPSTPNWQLVIEKGDKGDTGEMEVGTVTTVAHGNSATVTNVGTSTDAILNFQIPGGPRSTIDVGDVTTVPYGTSAATVTNVGTETDAIFDFEIPAGPRSTVGVGTVTTGSYSSSATITNVGTTSDAVFNFSIPQGIPGDFQPGENPPANPITGQVWYNTVVGRAYVYYDGFWIEFSPGFTGQQGPAGTPGVIVVSVPSTSSSTGTVGEIAYDSSYLYVCVATDSWIKVARSAW
jgi:hypothetical protein